MCLACLCTRTLGTCQPPVELLVSQLASVLELAYSVGVATEVLYGTLPRQLFEPNFSEFKIL